MNEKKFRAIAEAWWEQNKTPVSTEKCSTVEAFLQFYFARQDALAYVEDGPEDLAHILIDGVKPYKDLSWDALWSYTWHEDEDIETESGVISFLELVKEDILGLGEIMGN